MFQEVELKTALLRNPSVPISILFVGYVFYSISTFSLGVQGDSRITLAYFVLLYAWTAVALFPNMRLEQFNYLDVIMLLIFGLIGVSFIRLGFPGLSKYFFPLVLFPYFVGRLLPISKLALFVGLLAASGFLALAVSAFSTFEIIDSWGSIANRPSLYGSPVNTFLLGSLMGSLLLIEILFLLNPSIVKNPKHVRNLVWIALLSMPVLCYYLILMANKTAIVAIFLTSSFLIVVANHISLKRRLVILLIFSASIAGSIILSPDNTVKYYGYQNGVEFLQALTIDQDSLEESLAIDSSNTMATRATLWRIAFNMMKSDWLTGIGAGELMRLKVKPHSTIVQAFTELGVIGGGLLVVFYLMIFIGLTRTLASAKYAGTIVWYIGPLICYFFIFDQLQGNLCRNLPSFMLAGFAVSLYGKYMKNSLSLSSRKVP